MAENQYGEKVGDQWYVRKMQTSVWNMDGDFVPFTEFDKWDDDRCAAFDTPRIPPAEPAPAGQFETGRKLVEVDGRPVWQVTYGAEPADPAPVAGTTE